MGTEQLKTQIKILNDQKRDAVCRSDNRIENVDNTFTRFDNEGRSEHLPEADQSLLSDSRDSERWSTFDKQRPTVPLFVQSQDAGCQTSNVTRTVGVNVSSRQTTRNSVVPNTTSSGCQVGIPMKSFQSNQDALKVQLSNSEAKYKSLQKDYNNCSKELKKVIHSRNVSPGAINRKSCGGYRSESLIHFRGSSCGADTSLNRSINDQLDQGRSGPCSLTNRGGINNPGTPIRTRSLEAPKGDIQI